MGQQTFQGTWSSNFNFKYGTHHSLAALAVTSHMRDSAYVPLSQEIKGASVMPT